MLWAVMVVWVIMYDLIGGIRGCFSRPVGRAEFGDLMFMVATYSSDYRCTRHLWGEAHIGTREDWN